jgi:hypothetical protein
MSRAGPSRAISVRLTSVRHGRSGTAQPGSRPRWMAIHTVRHGLPNWLRGFDSRRPLQPADQWKRPPLPITEQRPWPFVPDLCQISPPSGPPQQLPRQRRVRLGSSGRALPRSFDHACWWRAGRFQIRLNELRRGVAPWGPMNRWPSRISLNPAPGRKGRLPWCRATSPTGAHWMNYSEWGPSIPGHYLQAQSR